MAVLLLLLLSCFIGICFSHGVHLRPGLGYGWNGFHDMTSGHALLFGSHSTFSKTFLATSRMLLFIGFTPKLRDPRDDHDDDRVTAWRLATLPRSHPFVLTSVGTFARHFFTLHHRLYYFLKRIYIMRRGGNTDRKARTHTHGVANLEKEKIACSLLVVLCSLERRKSRPAVPPGEELGLFLYQFASDDDNLLFGRLEDHVRFLLLWFENCR